LPIGAVVAAVFGQGGQPGSGTLSGGTPGSNGARILDASSGVATVDYTPGAEAARDTLVIALEDGEAGPGIELGRFTLVVREG
jgi:hypothetical protein